MKLIHEIEFQVAKLTLELYLKKRGIKFDMASPLGQTILNGIMQFVSTGDTGPMQLPPLSEQLDVAGIKAVATETLTLQLKKD